MSCLAGRCAAEKCRSAFAVDAVGVAVFLSRDLGAVADEEAGGAGELIVCLGDHVDDEFFAGEVGAGEFDAVNGVCFVQFQHDAAGIGGVGFFQGLEGGGAGFRDIGLHFVVVGCHGEFSFPLAGYPQWTLPDMCRRRVVSGPGGRAAGEGALGCGISEGPRKIDDAATARAKELKGKGIGASDIGKVRSLPRHGLPITFLINAERVRTARR